VWALSDILLLLFGAASVRHRLHAMASRNRQLLEPTDNRG
jgi:hypothetical protein